MERKGLIVNAGKTKIMICGTGLHLLQAKVSSQVPSAALVSAATILNATVTFTGCTRSTVGSIAFKRTQTTGALVVKELLDPSTEDHRRRFRLYLTNKR